MKPYLLLPCLLLVYSALSAQVPEKEPNNTFTTADTIHSGVVKTGNVQTGTDPDDYFLTVIPQDGTLKVTVNGTNKSSSTGYLAFYLYDKRKTNGPEYGYYVGSSNAAPGTAVNGTFTFYGLASDTFYLRINTTRNFDYTLSYAVEDAGPNDTEPNNSFDSARTIDQGVVKHGHLGYILSLNTVDIGSENTVWDNTYYYRAILPWDGTMIVFVKTKNNDQDATYANLYVYDSKKNSLGYRRIGNTSIPPGAVVYDTLTIHCLGSDTLYFQINTDRAFSYDLSFGSETGNTSSSEQEPNDAFTTAQKITSKDTVKAAIYYSHLGKADQNDYFLTTMSGKGSLKVYVEGVNTSDYNASLTIYAYNNKKNNGYLYSQNIPKNRNVSPGASFKDTIMINCVGPDTVYLRFTAGGCLSYTFHTEYVNTVPAAAFEYTHTGSVYDFTNVSGNSDNFNWDFDNGSYSSESDPPLISFLPGYYQVQLISRKSGDACNYRDTAVKSILIKGVERYTPLSGGAGNQFFTVYGGGFDRHTILRLTQGGRTYVDSNATAGEYSNIYTCWMDMHNAPLGYYDVDIITADSTYHFPNGFRLDAAIDKISVGVVGRDRVRYNDDYSYKVRVYNEGNTMAGMTDVFVLLPADVKVTLLDTLFTPDVFNDFNPDTIPEVIDVTKEEGFPIDGNVRGYIISGIPPGGYKDLSFTFNFPQLGDKPIYVWAKGPWDGSPWRIWAPDCWKAELEFGLKSVAVLGDVLGVFIDIRDWKNKKPEEVQDIETCAMDLWRVATTKATDRLTENVVTETQFEKGISTISHNKMYVMTALHCAKALGNFIPGVRQALKLVKYASLVYDFVTDIKIAYDAFVNMKEKCSDAPLAKYSKNILSATSQDPNAVSGPAGFTSHRYISGQDKSLSYTVFFENQRTAGLPAQTVTILDTLDTHALDLHTFRIGTFGIGNHTYPVAMSSQEFITEVILSNSISVRLNIRLDTAMGILKAVFGTVDRTTGLLTSDPLQGFLPPNVNAPDGDAYFTYTVDLKEGLSDGTRIDCRAAVIFDKNEPILTNTWSNTLDKLTPASQLSSATQKNDTTAVIVAGGSDAASGVEYYKLYMRKNGGPFSWFVDMGDSVTFHGDADSTYEFYVTAVDSAGNIEPLKSGAEQTVHLSRGPVSVDRSPLTGVLNPDHTVTLSWKTFKETNNRGFNMERNTGSAAWQTIGFISGAGTSTTTLNYTFVDSTVEPGNTYHYRYEQADNNDPSGYSNEVTIEVKADSATTLSMTVAPSPFIDHTTIKYGLPAQGHVLLRLFDLAGKEVVKLLDENKEAGVYTFDLHRTSLSGGIYILRLETSLGILTKKIVVLGR